MKKHPQALLPQANFQKKLVNKNAIKAKVGPPAVFLESLDPQAKIALPWGFQVMFIYGNCVKCFFFNLGIQLLLNI
jgi:hypothetical protein